MLKQILSITLLSVIACSNLAFADAPLKSALGLDMDQARKVAEIQSVYRKQYASVRTHHNNEERALRRARLANDSKLVASQEKVVSGLKAKLRQIKANEDAEIRKVLNPEQNKKFDAYIELRENMVGSSRDVRNHREQ